MANPPRSTAQRIADTLAKLAAEVDCWVPSASANGEAYLIPLSFVWHDGRLTLATPVANLTTRNLRRAGRARVALDGTRDVVLLEGPLTFTAEADIPPDFAAIFASATGFDPRRESEEYVYITLTPRRIQAWCEANELAGRDIMRDGQWQA
jgi:hypothetical protein